jgi:hypothetical protein
VGSAAAERPRTRRAAVGPAARLDLGAIEAALRARADDEARYAERTGDAALDADVARRMTEGYALVDAFLAEGRDPLALGQSRALLELNHTVLCGGSPERRAEHAAHLAATEARFYGDHEAGADGFYDWLDRHRSGDAAAFAARLYVRIVSSPQLFVEGNQRTAALCASHALLAAGAAPLVVDAALAVAFAPVARACRAVDRERLLAPLFGWLAARGFRRLLAGAPGARYLRRDAAAG